MSDQKPIHIKETMRDDGTKSIVYGENLDDSGRIGEPHGHIVTTKNSTIDYVRRPEDSRDNPLFDSKKTT